MEAWKESTLPIDREHNKVATALMGSYSEDTMKPAPPNKWQRLRAVGRGNGRLYQSSKTRPDSIGGDREDLLGERENGFASFGVEKCVERSLRVINGIGGIDDGLRINGLVFH